MEFSPVLFFKCCLLILQILRTANGACTFPSDLVGTWRSSRWDDLVFTSSQVTMPDFLGSSLTFNCDNQDGTKYLLRSTATMMLLNNNVEVAACLDLTTNTNGVKYIYYHATTDISLPGGDPQPVHLVVPGSAITTANTCTATSYTTGSNDVMVSTAALASAAESCPIPLLANFDNYTVTDFAGSSSCNGVGYIHICDDSQTVLAEYGLCSQEVFYSSGGNLSCVHSESSGSVYYTNLLNNDDTVDNTATYHYTCVVIETTGTVVHATQWPRRCHASQTTTSVPSSPGYKFNLYTNLTCVGGGGGAFSIIPIVVAILLILIAAAVLYFFCYRKKMYKKMPCYRKKDKKKKKKDNQVDPGASGNSVAPSSMDSRATGLQATAVFLPTDRSNTVTPFERRNLDTAQSTRSAITVSHMDAQILEDQTPRRLPPIEPKGTYGHQESDTSDPPSIGQRLPPINESLLGANDTGGGDNIFNSSSMSKSGMSVGGVVPSVIDRPEEIPCETSVPPEATQQSTSIDHGVDGSI